MSLQMQSGNGHFAALNTSSRGPHKTTNEITHYIVRDAVNYYFKFTYKII